MAESGELTSTFTGGALGWKPKGSFDPKFEDVAFALETSTTNNPKIGEAKTEFGYHIIMVSVSAALLVEPYLTAPQVEGRK